MSFPNSSNRSPEIYPQIMFPLAEIWERVPSPPSTARGKPVSSTEGGPVDVRQVKIKDVLNSHLPTESILISWRKQYDLSTHGPFSLFLLPG